MELPSGFSTGFHPRRGRCADRADPGKSLCAVQVSFAGGGVDFHRRVTIGRAGNRKFLQLGEIFTAVTSEMVIGVTLGLGVTIMFAAAQAAGARDRANGWNSMAEPNQRYGRSNDAGEPVFCDAFIGGVRPDWRAGTGAWFAVGNLRSASLGDQFACAGHNRLVGSAVAAEFLLTLRGVGPAVAALMISTIVIGLISRTYPQMNMLGIGLELKSIRDVPRGLSDAGRLRLAVRGRFGRT